MTIEEIIDNSDGKPYASCVWFDKNDYKSEKIYVIALKKYVHTPMVF